MSAVVKSMPVNRKSQLMLEIQLRSKYWLESDVLSTAEKRRLCEVVHDGIHTVSLEEINAMISRVRDDVSDYRPKYQRAQYRDNGPVSWEHFHYTDLLAYVDAWEQENPALKSVDLDGHPVVYQAPMTSEAAEVFGALRMMSDPLTAAEIAYLTGIEQSLASTYLQSLKLTGMVEKVTGHRRWRATEFSNSFDIYVYDRKR